MPENAVALHKGIPTMIKVIFDDTESDKMELETAEDFALVKKAVLERGDEFWDGEEGSCGISYIADGVEGAARLNIIAREEFGLILTYFPAGETPAVLLSTGVKDDRIVNPIVGGDYYPHFREYCVSRKIAWQAIEHFMKTGEKDPTLIWTEERVAD
jgi:hypothetical protein